MTPPANRMAYRMLPEGSEASHLFGLSTLSGLTRCCAVSRTLQLQRAYLLSSNDSLHRG